MKLKNLYLAQPVVTGDPLYVSGEIELDNGLCVKGPICLSKELVEQIQLEVLRYFDNEVRQWVDISVGEKVDG